MNVRKNNLSGYSKVVLVLVATSFGLTGMANQELMNLAGYIPPIGLWNVVGIETCASFPNHFCHNPYE